MEDKITKMIVLCDFSKKRCVPNIHYDHEKFNIRKMINVIHKISHELSHKMKIYLQYAIKRKYT